MTTNALGRLEEVDLRSIWVDEARDFTPWLARHLDELGAALHLDLQLIETEAAVGSFSIDILAEAEDGVVVIENQLERTDHSHLGQLLTYAAGREARTLIWITPEFRDEHRAALDWLNRWTSDEIEVYGVEVRAVRIGDSLPAPLFHAVTYPNNWSRQGQPRAADTEMSDDERARRAAFFDDLVKRAHARGLTNSTSGGSAVKSKTFPCRVGEPGFSYWVDLRTNGILQVQLYFRAADIERTAAISDALLEDRGAIEAELELQPEIRGPDPEGPLGQKAGLVRLTRLASIDDSESRLDAHMNWCVDVLERYQKVLEPRIMQTIAALDSEEA